MAIRTRLNLREYFGFKVMLPLKATCQRLVSDLEMFKKWKEKV